jgi:hypothetical protein
MIETGSRKSIFARPEGRDSMRTPINFVPLLVPPALSRRQRFALAAVFLFALAGTAALLVNTVHRIQTGDTVYGHLALYLSISVYLIYLLVKLWLLPPVQR